MTINLFGNQMSSPMSSPQPGGFQEWLQQQRQAKELNQGARPTLNFGAPMSGPGIVNMPSLQSPMQQTTPQITQPSRGLGIIPKAQGFNTQQQGLSDDEIRQLIQEGFSDDEIAKADEQLRNQIQPITKEKKEKKGIGSKIIGFGEGMGETMQGFVSQAAAIPGNIAGGILEYGIAPITGNIGEKFGVDRDKNFFTQSALRQADTTRGIGQTFKELIRDVGMYEGGGVGEKIGEEIANIGGTLLIPGGVLKKGVPMAQQITRLGAQGVIETAKYTAVAEGRAPDIKEAVIGGVVGGAMGGVAKGLSSVKDWGMSGLVNRAKLTQAKKMILDDVGEQGASGLNKAIKSPKDVNQWLLDRKMTGNKEEIIQKLIKNAQNSRQAVDNALGSINTIIPAKSSQMDSTRKALDLLFDAYKDDIGNDAIFKTIQSFQKKLSQKGGGMTVKEMNEVKRLLDRSELMPYTTIGKIRAGKTGLHNIRHGLKKDIENIAKDNGFPGIAKLNNETQVSNFLADAIGVKFDGDLTREMMSVFAPRTIGGFVGTQSGPFDNNTIEGKIGNFMIGWAVGGAVGSTKFKTNVASFINKMTPSQKGAIQQFIDSRGATPLPKQVFDKLKNFKKYNSKLIPKKPTNDIILPSNSVRNSQGLTTGKGTNITVSKALPPKAFSKAETTIKKTGITNKEALKTEARKILPKKKPELSYKRGEVLNKGTDKNTKIANQYKESAKERFKQGDFTHTEIRKGYEKLNSLYKGRKVELQDGTKFEIVSKPAYGKVKVKMQDGTIKNIDSESIYRNQKQATLKEVKDYLQGTEYNGYNLKPKILPTKAKQEIQTKLSKLNSNNIDEISKSITTDKTKLAQVKQVIKDHLAKYGNEFKEYMAELVDKISEKVGGKINLMSSKEGIGIDKTKMLSKSIPEKIYHTSSVKLPEKLSGDKILWTTKDKDYSLNYGKKGSRNTYEFSTEGLNILDGYSKKGIELAEKINKSLPKNKQFTEVVNKDGGVSSFFIQDKDVIKKLKDLGYDAIETSELYKGGTKSIGIINADKLKQVSKISDDLVSEAKKYKSTEEFIDNVLKKDKQVTLYRTSKSGKAHSDIKDFTFFSEDKDYVKQYLREGDKIVEYKLPESSLLRSIDTNEVQYLKDIRNPKIRKLQEIYEQTNKPKLLPTNSKQVSKISDELLNKINPNLTYTGKYGPPKKEVENIIKSFKTKKDLENFIDEKLFLLNKEAKNYSNPKWKNKAYGIKDNIVTKYGISTGEYHTFPKGGYGELYKLGNNTYHIPVRDSKIWDKLELDKTIKMVEPPRIEGIKGKLSDADIEILEMIGKNDFKSVKQIYEQAHPKLLPKTKRD